VNKVFRPIFPSPSPIPMILLRRSLLLCTCLVFAGLAASCRTSVPATAATWTPTGTVWKLVELNGGAVGASRLPSLTLDPGGSHVRGTAGVNSFTGTYTLQGETMSFGALAATKMAGPANSMQLETDFLQTLGRVTGWKIEGATLSLFAGETLVARFQGLPAGAPL